jgi:MYXO-CTERM domain-containing protein
MRINWAIGIIGAVIVGTPALARAEATASFTTSRTEGVAPLAVFFDARDSTCEGCAGVVDTWHDLAYRWNFGDADAGTWSVSGRSKNREIGPAAGHVFEQPGHYVVTLTVTDPVSGSIATTTHEIDVADPDQTFAGGNTICYRSSDSGGFDGCPAGAGQKTIASLNAVYSDCAGADHRCLLRRGDTFTAKSTIFLDANAPQILGAFGRGAKPVIDAAALGGFALFQGAIDGDDWRIMDLRLVGPAVGGSIAFFGKRTQRDILVMRVELAPATWHNFVLMDASQLSPKDFHERVFLVENWVPKAGFGNGGNILYIAYKDSAILGNNFQDTRTGEHILRAEAYDNLIIAHNELGGVLNTKHAITLRSWDQKAPCGGTICGPSKKGSVLANRIHINSGWTVQICGRAGEQANDCEDTIVDGNFLFPSETYPLKNEQVVIFQLADGDAITRRTSFRNNICNLTAAAPWCADMKVATLARALNNTCFRGDGGPIDCIRTGGTTPNGVSTIARNNLAFSAGKVNVVVGGWAENDHNVKATMNPFVSMTPGTDPKLFALAPGSEAIDAGVAVGNGFDISGLARPGGAAYDVGAWELGAMDDVEPLEVMISTANNPAAVDAAFKLDAATVGGSGTPTFAWDCDGDASFETDTGPAATVLCPGLAAGTYTVAVRATDASGSAEDQLALTVEGSCGDGVLDGGEACDGTDLAGESCEGLGFAGGTLTCVQCQIDTSSCTGDGTASGTEGGTGVGTGETGGDVPTTGSTPTSAASETGGDSSSTGDSAGSTGDGGCGCRTEGSAPAAASLAALALLLRRRRRANA